MQIVVVVVSAIVVVSVTTAPMIRRSGIECSTSRIYCIRCASTQIAACDARNFALVMRRRRRVAVPFS